MKRSARGFTLLELLIAMALLGLILVLLFGGLRLGVRSWDAAQNSADTMATVRSVEGFLRRELAQIQPYQWKGGTSPRLAFTGERDRLSFVAPLPARVGGGGLRAMSVALERDAAGQRIVWRQAAVNPRMQDFGALASAEPMVLISTELEGVEELWLSYFGRQAEGAESLWTDRWDHPQRLPQLIRVQVRLRRGAEWPEFVVAPMLATGTP